MADIYGMNIIIPNYLEEATSMGAAIIGGVGAGIFSDFDVIDKFINFNNLTKPDIETHAQYSKIKSNFQDAYLALEDLFGKL